VAAPPYRMSANSASLPGRRSQAMDQGGVRKICGLVARETVARLITDVSTSKLNRESLRALNRCWACSFDVRVEKLENP
jgi:hypothetical protein